MANVQEVLSEIEGGALERAAIERLVDALRSLLEAGDELALERELAAAPSDGTLVRWTALAVALSAIEPDDADALDRARRAALSFAELAATHAEGPAMMVRVARLRDELGIDGVGAAWAEAARREPLIAWAYPELTEEGDADVAVALLRSLTGVTTRGLALQQLDRIASGDDAPDAALAALSLERMADLAASEAPDLAAVRALAGRVRVKSLRVILEAAASVLAGDLGTATESLASIEDLASPEVARSIVDAMRAALRGGGAPDVRALLREAWLEAMIDPVVALAQPRSALAKLRSALIVLSITGAAAMAFTPAAQADDSAPKQSQTEQSRTEQSRTEQTQQTHQRDAQASARDAWSRDTPPSSAWARR